MKSSDFVTIVVLNDGETFSDIRGCSICVIPLKDYEKVLDEGGDAKDFTPIAEIGLDNLGPFQEEENEA
jgi:hypothetical protein